MEDVSAKTLVDKDGTEYETVEKEPLSGFSLLLETILNLLSFILWPLITIAGLAMDNSLVYGSVFGLNVPLFSFRNIMKVFANFILWFLFIVYLFKSFWDKEWSSWFIKKIFTKFLVAWVLVQFSWFIVAAVVDISTVATYSIWWLPLNVLEKTNAQEAENYVLREHVISSALKPITSSSNKSIRYQYGTWERSMFIPCLFTGWKVSSFKTWDDDLTSYAKTYLLGIVKISADNSAHFTGWQLTWNDKAVKLYENYKTNLDKSYCVLTKNWTKLMFIDSSKILNEKDGEKTYLEIFVNSWTNLLEIKKEEKTNCWNNEKYCLTMKNIMDGATGMSESLYTMYNSILSLWSANFVVNTKWDLGMTFEFIIRAFVYLALVIPLFVLAVIMIIRVWVLWMIIAFSPLLILAAVFKFEWLKKMWWWWDKFSVNSILWLVFMPVLVTFALSISIIFMNVFITQQDWTTQLVNALWFTKDWDSNKYTHDATQTTYEFITETTFLGLNVIQDFLSYIITNIFAIAFMWMVVFTALKASKITSKFVESVQNSAVNMIKAAPILPWWYSAAAIWSIPEKIQQKTSQSVTKQEQKMRESIDKMFGNDKDSWSSSWWNITTAEWLKTAYSKSNSLWDAVAVWMNQVEGTNHNTSGWMTTINEKLWWSASYKTIADALKSDTNKDWLRLAEAINQKWWIEKYSTGWSWWNDADKKIIEEAYMEQIRKIKAWAGSFIWLTKPNIYYDTDLWKMYRLNQTEDDIAKDWIYEVWKKLSLDTSTRKITMEEWTWTASNLVTYMNANGIDQIDGKTDPLTIKIWSDTKTIEYEDGNRKIKS